MAEFKQCVFQSTPPSRVATCMPIRTIAYSHPNFNPHHPRGWRRNTAPGVSVEEVISIHTTLAGGDVEPRETGVYTLISIHTTLAGGDSRICAKIVVTEVFQSTPPSRVATDLCQNCKKPSTFQSTPPSRVATDVREAIGAASAISIHTTLAGGDRHPYPPSFLIYISIHTTLAGGDDFFFWETVSKSISIHTTLAGGDHLFKFI